MPHTNTVEVATRKNTQPPHMYHTRTLLIQILDTRFRHVLDTRCPRGHRPANRLGWEKIKEWPHALGVGTDFRTVNRSRRVPHRTSPRMPFARGAYIFNRFTNSAGPKWRPRAVNGGGVESCPGRRIHFPSPGFLPPPHPRPQDSSPGFPVGAPGFLPEPQAPRAPRGAAGGLPLVIQMHTEQL